ncbi:uncharacterized protein [Haliotis cracherodii]|uniref:uncharacterized protein n=1 Tax=Haliotis cracherodii TaxID=6455 RepID=UPI0039E9897F
MKQRAFKTCMWLCCCGLTLSSLVCYFVYTNHATLTQWKSILLGEPRNSQFDLNASRVKSMYKLAGIALRIDNYDWASATDVCSNGIVFPSGIIKSLAGEVSVFFHDEKERRSTMRHMNKNGTWERRNLNTLSEIMENHNEAYFFDIYAGVGLYSLPIVKLGRKVAAIEYRYSFAERLCRGIIAGNFQHKAFIVNNFISHAHQSAPIKLEHLSQRPKVGGDMSGNMFSTVSSVKLNALLDRFSVESVVVRIDMTPEDIPAVLNADEFFEFGNVLYVLMEWTHISGSLEIPKLLAFMDKYDLVPCLNIACKKPLTPEQSSTWPAYVLWTRRELRPKAPAAVKTSPVFRTGNAAIGAVG